MSFTLNPAFRYRMPLSFGPAPGPRQKPGGGMWAAEETGRMNAEWMAVTYRTLPEKLEALLPPGMELRGEPLVTVSCAWFKNLYWLAGRGYGIVVVDFPVTYRGKTETLEGTFCPVLWEGAPDAIMTGRDELGFPKMFADIPEIEHDKAEGTAVCSASWMGFKFFDISLTDLVEAGNEPALPGADNGPSMYYKYVPRTSPGGREGADIAYVTTAAAPPETGGRVSNINFDGFDFKRWTAKGSVAWHRATFEQLPLSAHVVNGMADLDILEVTKVQMVAFSGPGIAISVNSMRAVEPS
ncbi:acetoacetate decarboxylase family protein [Agrobacterium vitis]|uniref:Acetoacetate decarboxylase n=1 Tax=Agrobacterium vitis TaxID=373 RepID=A0AAE4WA56_AGRVI|nr:acetoacetate decarboxylase family protein [Agrobacterium vitis]MCF1497385.1 acetoacetate decarboxylase [Allorhizobium sp. Av2]MCM2438920.1 acetoacetate decarboxylase family protein [Agrobacterium vitis]MUZ56802.1 acetoacetate decarboxylase [Agrobacterium vitis]MVA65046.1 acetoacetate decarboxylase [Agrobacterium vitis]MVA86061.1 acetoacetate decarboxylase [Agrobacterium vitis]